VDRGGGLLDHRAALARRRALPPLPRQGIYACALDPRLSACLRRSSHLGVVVLLLQKLKKKNRKPLYEALLKVKEGTAPHFSPLLRSLSGIQKLVFFPLPWIRDTLELG